MSTTEIHQPGDEFVRSAAHAVGYLLAIGALPALATGLLWRHGAIIAGVLLLAVVLMRTFLGVAVKSALSKMRARAVLSWTDMAAVFLFIASAYTVVALDALRQNVGWAAFVAVWALAALGCSVRMLGRAQRTWYSSTFLSRYSDTPQLPNDDQD